MSFVRLWLVRNMGEPADGPTVCVVGGGDHGPESRLRLHCSH
jgi:hypothetical protein